MPRPKSIMRPVITGVCLSVTLAIEQFCFPLLIVCFCLDTSSMLTLHMFLPAKCFVLQLYTRRVCCFISDIFLSLHEVISYVYKMRCTPFIFPVSVCHYICPLTSDTSPPPPPSFPVLCGSLPCGIILQNKHCLAI